MDWKRKLIVLYTNLVLVPFRLISARGWGIFTSMIYKKTPYSSQKTKHGQVKFFQLGEIAIWRAKTLLTKEPETLDWIDSFSNDAVFWDIGANIGCYALYAAKKGLRVIAFEPSSANYQLLCKNIELNELGNKVSALPVAFNDKKELGILYLSSNEVGAALHSFIGVSADSAENKDSPKVKFQQAMISYSIDEFINELCPPFPNYIKIDVDGIEKKIIYGAVQTLKDKRLKSIMIELDEDKKENFVLVMEIMRVSGFHLSEKRHSPMFHQGNFSCIFNYFFNRQ